MRSIDPSSTERVVLGALLLFTSLLAGCAQSPAAAAPAEESAVPEAASTRSQTVTIAGASNLRQVHALTTIDGRRLRPGVLYRSGHLAMVNEVGYAELVRLGIASVVDFRTPAEERAKPDAPWVISGSRHLVIDCPEPLPRSAGAYAHTVQALEPKLPALFSHLGAEGSLPALLHCGKGTDRACLGMGIVLSALGVAREQVVAELAGDTALRVDARGLRAVLDRMHEEGGGEAYLVNRGVALEHILALRAQALE